MKSEEREATETDLKDILLEFWLTAMNDPDNVWPERIKSSELLAKYILTDGKTPIRQRGSGRPSTADILKLATQLEKGNGFTMKEIVKELDGDGGTEASPEKDSP